MDNIKTAKNSRTNMALRSSDAETRLYGNTDREMNGCWLWRGARATNGYGTIRDNGKEILVHRLSWSLANNKTIPPGKYILHTCDVKNCVNPDHLVLGTAADNMADKVAKGRQATGEAVKSQKLSAELKTRIFDLLDSGKTAYAVSKLTGVSEQHIGNMRKKRALAEMLQPLADALSEAIERSKDHLGRAA